jgi:hypothetical protein
VFGGANETWSLSRDFSVLGDSMGVCVFDISRGQRSDSSSAADGGDFFHRPSGQEHEHYLVFKPGFSSGF